MNQTSAVDSDLQKAIEDITKSTNMDPLFADPVAAPAPNPAPNPAPAPVKMPTPPAVPPAPAAPTTVISDILSGPSAGPIATPPMPKPMPVAAPAPIQEPAQDSIPEPTPEPIAEPANEPTPIIEETVTETIKTTPSDMQEVKQAALRDLAPILSQLDINPEQKFGLYKNVISDLGDTSVVSPAYQAATNITDERERGEALLYLINTIDNM